MFRSDRACGARAAGAGLIGYKQAKERVFGPVMPVLFGVTLIAATVSAFLSVFQPGQATAAVLLIVALLIAAVIHLPLNKAIMASSAKSYPAEWSELRRRWPDWNWVRCLFAVSALLLALIG